MGYGRTLDHIKKSVSFVKEGLFTYLLPYMEEQATYDLVDFDYYTVSGTPYYKDPARDYLIQAYLCPDWPDAKVTGAAPAGYEYQLGAVNTYTGVGGAVKNAGETLVDSSFGKVPNNGAFLLKKEQIGNIPTAVGSPRRLAQITDGQSNSFMIGEFVHRNCKFGTFQEEAPGNVRPWYVAGFGDAPYQFKVLENPPNVCVSRVDINFNYLPLGSFHPGITQFVYIDGSVHIIADDIELQVYKDIATVNGGEVVNALP
jgi:hypothetical protein